jgi:hypothetical protein
MFCKRSPSLSVTYRETFRSFPIFLEIFLLFDIFLLEKYTYMYSILYIYVQ